jgi:hypothetical protein
VKKSDTQDQNADAYDLDSPFMNAPVWPWALAGWILAAFFLVLFVVARIHA